MSKIKIVLGVLYNKLCEGHYRPPGVQYQAVTTVQNQGEEDKEEAATAGLSVVSNATRPDLESHL